VETAKTLKVQHCVVVGELQAIAVKIASDAGESGKPLQIEEAFRKRDTQTACDGGAARKVQLAQFGVLYDFDAATHEPIAGHAGDLGQADCTELSILLDQDCTNATLEPFQSYSSYGGVLYDFQTTTIVRSSNTGQRTEVVDVFQNCIPLDPNAPSCRLKAKFGDSFKLFVGSDVERPSELVSPNFCYVLDAKHAG
jgi:hypothetical protein